MRLKKVLLFLLLIIAGITLLFTNQRSQKTFYLGEWQADLLPVQKNVARIKSLTYRFSDNSFTEKSIYETEGMNVEASVINHFTVLQNNSGSLTGKIYKKELEKLNYSFAETECKDFFDCQKRDLLKSTLEDTIKNNLKIVENKKDYEFKITKKDSSTLLMETIYGQQLLRKK